MNFILGFKLRKFLLVCHTTNYLGFQNYKI